MKASDDSDTELRNQVGQAGGGAVAVCHGPPVLQSSSRPKTRLA